MKNSGSSSGKKRIKKTFRNPRPRIQKPSNSDRNIVEMTFTVKSEPDYEEMENDSVSQTESSIQDSSLNSEKFTGNCFGDSSVQAILPHAVPVPNSAEFTMAKSLCIIEELLQNPFHLKTLDEKLKIVQNGRPCPEMNLQAKYKDKKGESTRHFQASLYKKTEWLTGSVNLNKLFCWPCLLFSEEKNAWSKKGFNDLRNVYKAIQKHGKAQCHIFSVLQLKSFSTAHSNQIDAQLQVNTVPYDGTVRKNREILKRLIDIVCFLVVHELPFHGFNQGENSKNNDVFLSMFDLLSKYDVTLSNHPEASAIFREESSKIQNDIICALSNLLLKKINSEISESTFVSLLLDETSNKVNTQMSTTIRYANSETGSVYERFVSFIDIYSGISTNELFKHVIEIINQFKLSNKLVAKTIDGATAMAGLRYEVQKLYPKAVFVHCFSHNLNQILSQSVSCIKECQIFFQTLTGLGSFFNKSSKRTLKLNEYTMKQMSKNASVHLNFSSCLVHTVKEYWSLLIGFFQHILNESSNWDCETIVAAHGFLKFLTDQQTVFLLLTFSRIFSYTDVLSDILQFKHLDILYCIEKIQETKSEILNLRHQSDIIWNDIQSYQYEENHPLKSHCSSIGPGVTKKVFYNIIDNITVLLEERFDSLKNLQFSSLLDSSMYESYRKKFPTFVFEKLRNTYKNEFDFIKLKRELLALYSFEDVFNKHPNELMCSAQNRNLNTALPEVYRLSLLISTIPFTTASVESSSALERIGAYQRCMRNQMHLPGLALLSIEKNLLLQLQSTPMFYEDVIAEYMKQEEKLEFTYK